jgi:imidazolonepropionase-like amidohydrolase
MTTLGALQAATINAATMLGKDKDVGSLDPGRYADVIAVRGDVLTHIDLLQRVDVVLKNGAVVKSSG